MKRFLFVLAFAAQVAVSQEVRGPFLLPNSMFWGTSVEVASVHGDTIQFLGHSAGLPGVMTWLYSTDSETLITGPTTVLPGIESWYTDLYGPVRLQDGWVALAYQSQQFANFVFEGNKLILIRESDGIITTQTLDSGHTHSYWTDSLTTASYSIEILPRRDGGFYTGRQHRYGVQDSSGQWRPVTRLEIMEYVHPDSAPILRDRPCGGLLFSAGADTLISVVGLESGYGFVRACASTRFDSIVLARWDDCSILDYGYLLTRENRLLHLTGYSPIMQLSHFAFDSTCQILSTSNVPTEETFSHPNYGFVTVARLSYDLVLGRIDLDGSMPSPPSVFAENALLHYVSILDNGDIHVIWSAYDGGSDSFHLMIIPWNAALSSRNAIPEAPQDFALSAYPNPFNSSVTIQYDLPQAGHVKLTAYDLQGRIVSNLFDNFAPAGSSEFRWTPTALASGVYFISLEAPLARATHKILFLK